MDFVLQISLYISENNFIFSDVIIKTKLFADKVTLDYVKGTHYGLAKPYFCNIVNWEVHSNTKNVSH